MDWLTGLLDWVTSNIMTVLGIVIGLAIVWFVAVAVLTFLRTAVRELRFYGVEVVLPGVRASWTPAPTVPSVPDTANAGVPSANGESVKAATEQSRQRGEDAADRQYVLLKRYHDQGLAQSAISFWFSI